MPIIISTYRGWLLVGGRTCRRRRHLVLWLVNAADTWHLAVVIVAAPLYTPKLLQKSCV